MSTSNKQQEEDYNLEEENLKQPIKQYQPKQRDDQKQQWQKKRVEGSGLFQKKPQRQNQSQDQEMETIPQLNVEDIQSQPNYQLEQELLNLIRQKVATKDREKAKDLLRKIESRESQLIIDDFTRIKIQTLLREQKDLSDKDLLNLYQEQEDTIGTKVATGQYELNDKFQKEMDFSEQIDYKFLSQYVDTNQIAKSLDGLNISQYEVEALEGMETLDPKDDYEGKLLDTVEELKMLTFDDLRDQYSIQRISDEAPQLDEKIYFKEQLEKIHLRQKILQPETNELEEPIQELLEEELENQGMYFAESEANEATEGYGGLEEDQESQFQSGEGADEKDLYNLHQNAKNMMRLNYNLKKKLVQQTKGARQLLNSALKQRDNLLKRLDIMTKDHVSDAIPNKLYDFTATHFKQALKNYMNYILKKRKYDPISVEVENYSNELGLYIRAVTITQDYKNPIYANSMERVINDMNRNKVEPDAQTHSRLFEYGVIAKNNDFANKKLKYILQQEFTDPYALINKNILKRFFIHSLRTDNFDGLGYLSGYVSKHKVDISQWPLEKFKSALEFYLNQNFNLSKVLIFTNFYSQYHSARYDEQTSKLDKPVHQLTDDHKYAINKEVFKNTESIVDMRALFGHLVKEIKHKEPIDPITKEDAMWKIIDTFTRRGAFDVSKKCETLHNTLDEKDIAMYFKNHFNSSTTFDKVTQVILRLNDTPGSTFQNHIIQNLREYVAQNSALPFSFETLKIRNAYFKLKSARKSQDVKFSEKTLEYFLFLFKELKMWPEIIDLCENYNNLSQSQSDHSEIKTYYLTEALFQIPSSKHYHKLIQEAVYQNQEIPQSAGYVTAMTKAYFKDGSTSHAIKFFIESIQEMKELKEKREDVLIKLFDSVYSEENPDNLSYEQFKAKYLNVMTISNRLVKESFAVNQLKRVLYDKDYDEIDTLFQLYLVEKEETQLLSNLPNYKLSLIEFLRDTPVENIHGLNEQQRNRLSQARERSKALRSKLSAKDVQIITQLLDFMKDHKVQFLKNVNAKTADELQQVFNIMSEDQVKEILDRTDPIFNAATSLLDQDSSIIGDLHVRIKEETERAVEENFENIYAEREFPRKGMDKIIERMYDPNNKSFSENTVRDEMDLDDLTSYVYDGPLIDENDPMNMMEEIHNRNLSDLKEELLEALQSRRDKVLSIQIEIFNKIQDQTVNKVQLNTVEDIDQKNFDVKSINENLSKYDAILNDQRSPVYSALNTMAMVDEAALSESFDQFFTRIYDYQGQIDKYDFVRFKKENEHLEELNDQIEQSLQSIRFLQNQIVKQINEKDKISVSSGKMHKNIYEQSYKRWAAETDEQLSSHLEKRIQELYQEYKQQTEMSDKVRSASELSKDQKLQILRDIFTVEYQDNFTNNMFPVFYSQDLIMFGLEHNVPEAVRLGEKMMSDNNQTLSLDLQKAVKSYLLSNSEKYHQAMKNTGPINNTTLYKKSPLSKKDEQPAIFSYDDPYWQEFFEKNKRRSQLWKIPSSYAWDHKPHGILGEIIDYKNLENMAKKCNLQGSSELNYTYSAMLKRAFDYLITQTIQKTAKKQIICQIKVISRQQLKQ